LVEENLNLHCIILARGGSKSIPGKNTIDFLGKPLIAWTIEQCMNAVNVSDIWVSSNDSFILSIAKKYGAKTIKRPDDISGDLATSESGWLHAVNYLNEMDIEVKTVLAPQVTSPLRETSDINAAVVKFVQGNYDSMFSASIADDLFFWEDSLDGVNSINYDYKNRKRRQDFKKQIIENGSFYLFKTEILKEFKNRIGGKIGFSTMDFWKMFEIDNGDDLRMCSALMKEFLIKD
jgi:CMP-N,N'-diacetyllegionaminic acid synthase